MLSFIAHAKTLLLNLGSPYPPGGGYNFENIVKTTIFISDMNNFGAINAVYGTYFNEATAPARETVEVANLPKFVNVEISAIAIK